MGIDVYMHWVGQTEDEREAQFTGMSRMAGHVGYLREAYSREHYATKVMFPEYWQITDDYEHLISGEACQTFPSGAFTVVIPDPKWPDEPNLCIRYPVEVLQDRLDEALATCAKRYEGEPPELIEQACRSYEAFVEMYATLDRMGKDPAVLVSY